MINNNKPTSIKNKFLKPLVLYTLIFLFFLLLILNSILKYFFSFTHSEITASVLFKINILFILLIGIFLLGFIFITIKLCNALSKDILILLKDTKNLVTSTYSIDDLKSFNYKEIEELNINILILAKKLYYYHKSQKAEIANASHQLRTPLMSIQGYAEAIKYNVFEDINEPIDIIIEESLRLSNLIKGILKLSQMDSKNIEINLKNINLYKTLNRIANSVRGLAFKNNKTIYVKGDKNLNILTDEKLLGEAVINLISNALTYAKEKITLTIEKNDCNVIIHIKDDGAGIKEEDLDHLFVRYYKGDKGNFGLGLSIAQSAINYLNGEITAYNKDDGACFDIILNLDKNTQIENQIFK
ncbi:sensor histidine kinase [Clostridium tarantellae]|uniref:histidine kinase n=1 Tax=Clostridium tarantellae TaxID=39493 RepID=A0A6I1MM20_9CLOT|nr:HAMP domain-containing sensor histidine kinase [Clostridium tarantellae]MPQ43292.1 hypothetical protein [Clostridium tarantellae]